MLDLIDDSLSDINLISNDEDAIGGWDADLENESESEIDNFPDKEKNGNEEEIQSEKQCFKTNCGNCVEVSKLELLLWPILWQISFLRRVNKRETVEKEGRKMIQKNPCGEFYDWKSFDSKAKYGMNEKWLVSISPHQKETASQKYVLDSPIRYF